MGKTMEEKLVEVAKNVPKVYEAGYNKGYSQGEEEGLDAAIAVQEEFLADKPKTYYDVLWDSAKETMEADAQWFYNFAGSFWNDYTFNPPFDLIVPYTSGLFFQSLITDLKGILDRNGVKLDFSKSERLNSIVESSTITRMGIIDTRSCTALQNFLHNGAKLKYVEKIILKNDGSQTVNNLSFSLLSELEHCIFEGVIGRNGFNLQWSTGLSKASIESIIKALSTTTSGLTVTLSQTAIDNAFTAEEWEALEATRSNWTISLL